MSLRHTFSYRYSNDVYHGVSFKTPPVKLRAENFFNGVLFFLKFRPQILHVGFYFSQNFPRASRGVLFYIFCCIKTMLFSTVNLKKACQNTSKFSALRAGSYFFRFSLFKSWVRVFIFSSLIPILFGRGYVDGGVIKANPMVADFNVVLRQTCRNFNLL